MSVSEMNRAIQTGYTITHVMDIETRDAESEEVSQLIYNKIRACMSPKHTVRVNGQDISIGWTPMLSNTRYTTCTHLFTDYAVQKNAVDAIQNILNEMRVEHPEWFRRRPDTGVLVYVSKPASGVPVMIPVNIIFPNNN